MEKDKNTLTNLTEKSSHTDRDNPASKRTQSDPNELQKSTAHIIVEIIEYVPHAVVSKTIIRKTTGNITVSSFAIGEELAEKISPFDTYVQIIDGSAEMIINDKKYRLCLGEGIVIPAHAPHCFNANEQFKMISTVIKSGYEL
ncbi:MAG TPA: cupin domain-containing protein [Puia sp.]|nr:cupin domain-containing protein [Puia sp.]